jgi:hypothetical protein
MTGQMGMLVDQFSSPSPGRSAILNKEVKVATDFMQRNLLLQQTFLANKVPDKQTFTVNEVHSCISGVVWL